VEKQTIHIDQLLLDLDNSRYPDQPESQQDALYKMIQLQGDKLVKLAKDIIKHGLDPSERVLVLKEDDDAFTVVEGNRRLTTLKLLHDPELVAENKTTKKIKALLEASPSIPEEFDCVVFAEESEYEHWIDLKHAGQSSGAGRVNWTGQETDRYRAKHGRKSYGNQLLSFIRNESSLPDSIQSGHKRLFVTNLTRLLSDKESQKRLGISPVSGILYCSETKDCFIGKVLIILETMLELDEKGKNIFTVNRIKVKKDRKIFMDELGVFESGLKIKSKWPIENPGSYIHEENEETGNSESPGNASQNPSAPRSPAVPQEYGTNSEFNDGVEQPPTSSSNPASKPNQGNSSETKTKEKKREPYRNNIVPAGTKLKILDAKCNGVFKELKSHLTHEKQGNSVAVMFRVFLELSINCYIERNKLSLEAKKSGLHDKVVAITHDLVNKRKLNNKQRTAIQAASSDALKSTGSLQQYVHNNHMFPDKSSINTMWDNFEPMIINIWPR